MTRPIDRGGLGFPAGTQFTYTYTNRLDETGKPMAFSTPNGLVAPGGEWHVDKPISAFQDQFQLKKAIGRQNIALGLYFANYSQDNQWYFTDILTDVENNPSFLDLTVLSGGKQINVTKDGFRHYISNYVNGSGQATILSGSLGGEFVSATGFAPTRGRAGSPTASCRAPRTRRRSISTAIHRPRTTSSRGGTRAFGISARAWTTGLGRSGSTIG